MARVPIVPVARRNKPGFCMDDYKYQGPAEADQSKQDYSWNQLLNRFMTSSYVKEYVARCKINVNAFLAKYLTYIVSADVTLQRLYDNLHTTYFKPETIFGELNLVFGAWPQEVGDLGPEREWHYGTLVYYMRARRNEWTINRQGREQWKRYDHVDNLWCWFMTWFLDTPLAGLIMQRYKIERQEPFEPAQKEIEVPVEDYKFYPAPDLDLLEHSLYVLMKWSDERKAERERIARAHKRSRPRPPKDAKKPHIAKPSLASITAVKDGDDQHTFDREADADEGDNKDMDNTTYDPQSEDYIYSSTDPEDDDDDDDVITGLQHGGTATTTGPSADEEKKAGSDDHPKAKKAVPRPSPPPAPLQAGTPSTPKVNSGDFGVDQDYFSIISEMEFVEDDIDLAGLDSDSDFIPVE